MEVLFFVVTVTPLDVSKLIDLRIFLNVSRLTLAMLRRMYCIYNTCIM